MRLIRDIAELPDDCRGAVIAIGNFDGVHLGHRAVLGQSAAIADAEGRKLGALVFEPHPREFFQPDAPRFRLTPLRAKVRLLEALDIDLLYVERFDAALAAQPAEDYIRTVLVEGLRVAHVVVGYDFRFGRGRTGDAALLRRFGKKHGFGVSEVAAVNTTADGEPYSSSLIRTHLREGRPGRAAELLGHWWSVESHVITGDQRGRTIGFPTANLRLDDCLEPRHGVYAVRVQILEGEDAGLYDGVANLGLRPTFDKQEVMLEVNLFDYKGDLYGRLMRVSFVDFLRPEQKFDGLDSLKAQIARDSEDARRILCEPDRAADRFTITPLR